MTTHSNQSFVNRISVELNGDTKSNDDDFEHQQEGDSMIEEKDKVFVRLQNPNFKNPVLVKEIILNSKNILRLSNAVKNGNSYPQFELDVDRLKIVKYSEEFLLNLNLSLTYKNVLMITSFKEFDETLSYSSEAKEKAKQLILNRGAYFHEDSNYFDVIDEKHISKGTNISMLRNSRVTLFWRNVELSDSQKKRILSLGLSYMIGIISYAELYYCIQRTLQNGSYNISVRTVPKTFVLIGVEREIFSF